MSFRSSRLHHAVCSRPRNDSDNGRVARRQWRDILQHPGQRDFEPKHKPAPSHVGFRSHTASSAASMVKRSSATRVAGTYTPHSHFGQTQSGPYGSGFRGTNLSASSRCPQIPHVICMISPWLLIRPGPPRPDDSPAGLFRRVRPQPSGSLPPSPRTKSCPSRCSCSRPAPDAPRAMSSGAPCPRPPWSGFRPRGPVP